MTEAVLDIRTVTPWKRHSTVSDTFDQLAVGDSFVLVNDHDPVPLYRQFNAQRQGTFEWAYNEKGPALWRVRITKTSLAFRDEGTCCGTCGG